MQHTHLKALTLPCAAYLLKTTLRSSWQPVTTILSGCLQVNYSNEQQIVYQVCVVVGPCLRQRAHRACHKTTNLLLHFV